MNDEDGLQIPPELTESLARLQQAVAELGAKLAGVGNEFAAAAEPLDARAPASARDAAARMAIAERRSHAQADLILRLYDMRREPVMRAARHWWVSEFHPTSAKAALEAMRGPQGAYFRQVIGYWEMAATLVKYGAIDRDLFHEANQEHVFVFAKIEPWIVDIRREASPRLAVNLEALIHAMPDWETAMKSMRARQAEMAKARAAG